MKKDSIQYTFLFALIVCVVCSFALSLVSEGLRPKKELNIAMDIKKNILKAAQLREPLPPKASTKEVLDIYKQKIEEVVIDNKGNIVPGKTPADIEEGDALYPLYIYKEDGKVLAYAFQIIGKGLWSTLKGYMALEPDAKTVRGITFYSHGETPGLGAEIDTDWFQNNFKGKKIWDNKANALHPVAVVKGHVEDKVAEDKQQFYVDGISGATLTSNGVTAMIDKELHQYEPFFSKIRK